MKKNLLIYLFIIFIIIFTLANIDAPEAFSNSINGRKLNKNLLNYFIYHSSYKGCFTTITESTLQKFVQEFEVFSSLDAYYKPNINGKKNDVPKLGDKMSCNGRVVQDIYFGLIPITRESCEKGCYVENSRIGVFKHQFLNCYYKVTSFFTDFYYGFKDGFKNN